MHPSLCLLSLTTTIVLLSLAGLPSLELQPFVSSSALGQTTKGDSRQAEAERLKSEGEQATQKSQFSEALDKLQKAINIYQAIGDRSGQASTLNSMGIAYDGLSDYKKMGESYQKALVLSRESQNRLEEGIALNGIGDIYFYQSDYGKALEFVQQALSLCAELTDFKCKALSLRNLGTIHSVSGEKQKALAHFNQSLPLFKAVGDRSGEALTLHRIGLVYSELGEKQKALAYYTQALPLLKAVGDRSGEATFLYKIGGIYDDLGEKQKALDYYIQSLPLWKSLGIHAVEINILNSIGMVYDDLGEKQKALDYYNQTLLLRKAVEDRSGQANSLIIIGAVYFDLGENQKALAYFTQALTLRKALGDRSGEAATLKMIGRIYNDLGEKQKALKYFTQALSLDKAVKDRSGEATTLTNLGQIYADLGENQKALAYFIQSLPLWKALADHRGEAKTLNNIGGVYSALGEKQKALKYFTQALFLSKAMNDRAGEAATLTNLGQIYADLGENQKALAYFIQSLPLWKALADHRGEAKTLNNIGGVYDDLGEKQKALRYYTQALSLSKAVNDRAGEASTVNNIGAVYSDLGEKQKALEYYNQALPLFKAVGNRSGEATTLSNVAYVLAKQQQPALAIVFYKQSVNITESLRNDIRGLPQETQQTYTQSVARAYRTLADLLLEQDRVLEAQQVLDLLKVQELEDYLTNVRGTAQTAKGIDYLQPEQQILNKYDELQKSAIQLGQELSQLRKIPEAQRTVTQQQRIAQLIELDEELNRQFNDFARSSDVIGSLNQLTFNIQQQIVPLADLDRLRNDLKQLNAVLLYPLVLEDRLELILTTPDSAPLRRVVKVSSRELNQTVLKFRQLMEVCETRKACTAEDTAQVKTISQKLYTWLIKPLEADLKQANAQSIIYAPDGQLRYIPLAALHDGTHWLVQRLRVNNITAKSLDSLEPQPHQTNLRVLAGAFTQGSYQFSVGSQQFNFKGLPFANKEIAQLVAAVPDTTQFLDKDFSLAAVKPRMNEYSILHFATHAAFLLGQPEDSFILFGNGDRATLRDIENWSLFNVDLVILSACQTALGLKLGNGVEILGLGYQFQNRGVKTTIASLWQVNDQSTQILMNSLYTQLKQGKVSTAEALRQAQLTLIQSKNGTSSQPRANISVPQAPGGAVSQHDSIDYSHPYYWSPFILIGNGL